MKIKKCKIFPAILLTTAIGFSLVQCGKKEESTSVIDVLEENSKDTCLDEVLLLGKNELTLTECNGDRKVSLQNAILKMEENIGIFELLQSMEEQEEEIPTIDVSYVVEEQDTLDEIAKKYGIEITDIKNEVKEALTSDVIHVGDILYVKQKQELTLQDVKEYLSQLEEKDIPVEEKDSITKKLVYAKNSSQNWLCQNGNRIMESFSMAVVKSSVLDALDCDENSYSDISILPLSETIREGEMDDVELWKEEKSNYYQIKGDLSKMQQNIYDIQSFKPLETITDNMLEFWKQNLDVAKSVIKKDSKLDKGIFHDSIKLVK